MDLYDNDSMNAGNFVQKDGKYLPLHVASLKKEKLFPHQDTVMATVERILQFDDNMKYEDLAQNEDFKNLRQWVTDLRFASAEQKLTRAYFLRERKQESKGTHPVFDRPSVYSASHDLEKGETVKLFRCEKGMYSAWALSLSGTKHIESYCCLVAKKDESNSWKAVENNKYKYICDNPNQKETFIQKNFLGK
jgi:hypothetical protein